MFGREERRVGIFFSGERLGVFHNCSRLVSAKLLPVHIFAQSFIRNRCPKDLRKFTVPFEGKVELLVQSIVWTVVECCFFGCNLPLPYFAQRIKPVMLKLI